MKFIEVTSLPDKKRSKPAGYKSIRYFIEEFISSGVKYAKVMYDKCDYTHNRACVSALRKSIKTQSLPIRLQEINTDIYLIRKDLEG